MKMMNADSSCADARWEALVASRADGAENSFFYGVKTTGVFCRPSCHSRLPKREHVLFFPTAAEALQAGFRPCKRCQPDGPGYAQELDSRIARACRALEATESPKSLKALARSTGLSEFHFHRLFKARLGVTPKQYHTQYRLGRFKKHLRAADSVTEALYGAGFGSSSRAYEGVAQKLGMSPRQFRMCGQNVEICFALERSKLGWVLVAATDRGVCSIELGSNAKALRKELAAQFPKATLRENRPALKNHLAALRQYLANPARGLSLPLDIAGTAFQQRVWQALRDIPIGQTATYRQIARQVDAPQAVRAVGSACGANKLALAIPCHRVVRTDGSLGGYRWGIEHKRALLEAERVAAGVGNRD